MGWGGVWGGGVRVMGGDAGFMGFGPPVGTGSPPGGHVSPDPGGYQEKMSGGRWAGKCPVAPVSSNPFQAAWPQGPPHEGRHLRPATPAPGPLSAPDNGPGRSASWCEGIRGAGEVLRSGVPVEFALVSPRLESTERGPSLSLELSAAGVETVQVDDTDLAQAADTETPQGVILVCPEPHGEPGLNSPEDPGARYLVVDGVQDPGNLGDPGAAPVPLRALAVVLLHGTTDP